MKFLTRHSTANNPLLRLFVAVLLIVLPLLGFAFGIQYQAAVDKANQIFVPSVSQPIPKPTPIPDRKYANEKLGFSFHYPDHLILTEKNSSVELFHSIPYKNSGGCDMSGDVKTYDSLTDFHMTFEIKPGRVVPAYTDGNYMAGGLSGVWQYEGAEGCGNSIYFLYLPDNRTLVVTREMIQAFSGISTMWNVDEIMKVPGAIGKEENEEIFNRILESVRMTDKPTAGYSCPPSGWADCMPGPGRDMSQCSSEAMAWYRSNCPGFKGAAY